MVDVAAQRRVGIVNESMLKLARRSIHLHGGVGAVFFKFSRATPNQAQLGIRIEPAMLDPAAKEKVLTGNPEPRQLVERAMVAGGRSFALCGLTNFS